MITNALRRCCHDLCAALIGIDAIAKPSKPRLGDWGREFKSPRSDQTESMTYGDFIPLLIFEKVAHR
jgi:hypothetical protein